MPNKDNRKMNQTGPRPRLMHAIRKVRGGWADDQRRIIYKPTRSVRTTGAALCTESQPAGPAFHLHVVGREAVRVAKERRVELTRKQRRAVVPNGVHLQAMVMELALDLVTTRARAAEAE